MSINKKIKKNKKINYTEEELKILMKNFDIETYDTIIQKKIIKQLGSAILSQHKKLYLREVLMLLCGGFGGFGIASLIFGFASGIFVGV